MCRRLYIRPVILSVQLKIIDKIKYHINNFTVFEEIYIRKYYIKFEKKYIYIFIERNLIIENETYD